MNTPSLLRTRWAAVGAAVAITLGAGGIGYAGATVTSGERTVFVPITPCRIMDTRPNFQVGPRATPLGSNETYSVTGVGASGTECAGDLPADALGLVLNVTALGATLPTFITIYPTGETRPNTSSLNPSPGQPPTPNAVTTSLGTGNQFSVYNRHGNVHVLADVVGYYAHHNHDDRYYTKSEADTAFLARIEALEAGQPFAVSSTAASTNSLTNVPTAMLDVSITAPADGQVTINYSAVVSHSVVERDVRCAPFRSTDSQPVLISGLTAGVGLWKRAADASSGSISGALLFDIAAGDTITYSLLCHEFDQDGGLISGRAMTAIFTPAP